MSPHILTAVTFLPLLGAALLLFFRRPVDEEDAHGNDREHNENVGQPAAPANGAANAIRYFTLGVTLATFVLSIVLLAGFRANQPGFQFVVGPFPWISAFNVRFHLGIDGISLLLILLTTFLSVLSVLFSFSVKRRVKEYMIFLLVLQTAMTGVFCALDLVLFYVFWEAVLIPMYFLIGIWGHENRIYAAIKFFLYTFAASVLMLVGIVTIYIKTQSFSLVDLLTPGTQPNLLLHGLDPRMLGFLFGSFALAFMVKVPMFPFHTWLPDAHVEAPTAGSVILAGIMLKMGAYGFLRFCLPLFPAQAAQYSGIFIALSIIGIIYGAVVAAVQPDMKKLVAYSSVSHLGFVMLGIFTFTPLGLTGAVLQSINHGVSTGMLFFLVGMLYERRHTREIAAFGGLKRAIPILSTFFLIAMLSSVALPLTNGFVGEFTILQGSFSSSFVGFGPTALAATGMVLSAIYMLWLFQRVFTGPVDKEANRHLPDLSGREKWVLVPLVVMVFWFGCYVTTWTRYLDTPIAALASGPFQGAAEPVTTAAAGPHVRARSASLTAGMVEARR
jgi:NADH-quinone oxidoreductase subunit M